jgi:hypothetical protein
MDRCPHCNEFQRLKKRDFSSEAWIKLIDIREIEPEVAGQPICDGCAAELRHVLIEEQEVSG